MQFSRHWIALILVLLAGNTIAGIPTTRRTCGRFRRKSGADLYGANDRWRCAHIQRRNYPKPTVILFYHYTLLSDSKLEAAKAFHIAYHVDDGTVAKMRSMY